MQINRKRIVQSLIVKATAKQNANHTTIHARIIIIDTLERMKDNKNLQIAVQITHI